MGHRGKKRSQSSNSINEENSPKKLKNERTMSSEDTSPENGNVKNPILNDKKHKKSKREKTELSKLKMEETVEEKVIIESEKKSKSNKEKRKLEKKARASDEVTQNVENTENDLEVKKKKFEEENSQIETEVKEEESAENGEDDSAVKKKKNPSKRQLKKEKQELREKEKREATKMESATKALNYISKWKHARSEWKFEKVKQIWLTNNLLDESLVPEKLYPTVLEYFEGCKGMVKDQLLKKAMAVIKKMEELSEESEDVVKSVEYQRARQLLQALPTET